MYIVPLIYQVGK